MIDRDMTMRLRAHEPIALQYRRALADGTTRELLGEVYALTIYAADGTTIEGVGGPMSAASTIRQDMDGDYAEMILPPGSAALLVGRIGLMWELAELLPDSERDPRHSGRIIVEPAASTVTGTASLIARGDSTMIIERDA